tara:strand:- start:695 stop:1324 length:630 start_codon:yes stop_codon:yes gene_type:complete
MPVTINGDGSIVGLAVGGLPDGSVDADTLATNAVTTVKIANSAVTSIKTSGLGGLTVADQWRITSDATMGTDTVTNFTSNWERADTYGAAQLGSGMTESSGIFTFPSTGIYHIIANQVFSRTSAANRYAHLQLRVTTDNSSYNVAATGGAGFGEAYQQNTASLSFLFDVTNTSTHKVRFSAYTNRSSVVYRGSTDANTNSYTFIKLGET